MTVRYHTRRGVELPEYICQKDAVERADRVCQVVPGAVVDVLVDVDGRTLGGVTIVGRRSPGTRFDAILDRIGVGCIPHHGRSVAT